MARRNRRRARRATMPEVSLTPLTDTALTLLLIFMVTAPMVQNGIKVALPQEQTQEGGLQQDIVVTITKEQQYYFGEEPLEHETLIAAVQEAIAHQPDTPVYLRADEGLAYGSIIALVDELKLAGVHLVALSTRAAQ